MYKSIPMVLVWGKTCCLIVAILVTLAGKLSNVSAQTLTILYSFGGSPSNGSTPLAALVQGNDGNFYGTTQEGGTSGYGIVFRISPSGSYSNLHSFGSSANDGIGLNGELVLGSDGNF